MSLIVSATTGQRLLTGELKIFLHRHSIYASDIAIYIFIHLDFFYLLFLFD